MTAVTGAVRRITVGRTPRLVVLAAVVGAGAGLGAVLLIESIKWVGVASKSVIDAMGFGQLGLLIVLPFGLWLAWRLTSLFAPEVAGHGVPQILASIAVQGGKVRQRVIPLKTVATALSIGSGGSAGREGSIAQIGSAIGSTMARWAHLGENDVIALVAAGAGAGISATFNAPIAGMFFAMEIILREISIRHLHTVVIASVSGAVVAHTILGDKLTFDVPQYTFDNPSHLVLYALLGLVAVGFGWFYQAALDWFEVNPVRISGWVRPVLFGLFIAGLGLIWNDALGTGQQYVNDIVANKTNLAWWSLGMLALVKAVTTSATLGGKGAGGIFMPSLFIGATAGTAFAQLVETIRPSTQISPGAFGLVGMAATFSAVARAPLTSILIVFEITGDYGLVLPLMVATIVSTPLAARLRRESAYTAPLARKGIHPASGSVTDLLDTVLVRNTMGRAPITIGPEASVGEALGAMRKNRVRGLPVVSDDALVGIITEGDIVRAGGPSDQTSVGEAMTPNPATVSELTPVSDALERMAALGIGRLPIVSDDDETRLVGVFSRDDVVTSYHNALGAHSRITQSTERLKARTGSEAAFYELDIPTGSMADGRKVSEIQWPEGSLLVSIHRGSRLVVPSGDTTLAAGDSITLFGRAGARDRMRQRLTMTADEAATAADQTAAED